MQECLTAALRVSPSNSAAARALAVSPSRLHYCLEKYGIKEEIEIEDEVET